MDLASRQCTCSHGTVYEGFFVAAKQINVLEHPAYSPDLAPSDFILFPKINKIRLIIIEKNKLIKESTTMLYHSKILVTLYTSRKVSKFRKCVSCSKTECDNKSPTLSPKATFQVWELEYR
jgi:hypothetical protein